MNTRFAFLLGLAGLLIGTPAWAQSVYDLGTAGTSAGSLKIEGGTSGNSTISVPAVAGSGTNFQLPGNNGTSTYLLQTDGSGNTSWVAPPATGGALTNTVVSTGTSATCGKSYIVTAAATITLPLTTGQTTGCQIAVKNETVNTGTAAVVIAVNAADSIGTGSTGVGQTLLPGQSSWFGTNAANNWYRIGSQAACVVYTSSATVPITATRALYVAIMGSGGPGGNGGSTTTTSTVATGGGGGGPGQFIYRWYTGPNLTQFGTSVTLTIPSPPTPGNNGAVTTFGSFLTANGGKFALSGGTGIGAGGASAGLFSSGGGSVSGGTAAAGYSGIGAGGAGSSATGGGGAVISAGNSLGPFSAASGSSGAGITAADAHSTGAAGNPSQFAAGGAAGAAAGGTGANAANYNTAPYVQGAAGGSGGSSNNTDGGNGGAAGISGWGAGGSGGGACENTTSCTGGVGANGGASFLELCQW